MDVDILADTSDLHSTHVLVHYLFFWTTFYEKQETIFVEIVYAVLQYFSNCYKFLSDACRPNEW